MRAVISRVLSASVEVDGNIVGVIERGLLVLLGFCREDDIEDEKYSVNRLLSLRLFDGEDGKSWSSSVTALKLPVLLIPNFTLYAETRKPKPDFHAAMGADAARLAFESFVDRTRVAHGAELVQTGIFQSMMNVSSVNDGPVTVILDSKAR